MVRNPPASARTRSLILCWGRFHMPRATQLCAPRCCRAQGTRNKRSQLLLEAAHRKSGLYLPQLESLGASRKTQRQQQNKEPWGGEELPESRPTWPPPPVWILGCAPQGKTWQLGPGQSLDPRQVGGACLFLQPSEVQSPSLYLPSTFTAASHPSGEG